MKCISWYYAAFLVFITQRSWYYAAPTRVRQAACRSIEKVQWGETKQAGTNKDG